MIIMIDHLKQCLQISTDVGHEEEAQAAKKELMVILEKLEIGLEAIANEDRDWSYSYQTQIDSIKKELKDLEPIK